MLVDWQHQKTRQSRSLKVSSTCLILKSILNMFTKLFVCLALVYLSTAYTIPFEGESSAVVQHNRVRRQKVNVDVENRGQDGRDLGTKVTVHGGTRVWESEDGRGTLDAKAHYQRDFGGRNSGQDNYGGKLSFGWDFGKD